MKEKSQNRKFWPPGTCIYTKLLAPKYPLIEINVDGHRETYILSISRNFNFCCWSYPHK